MTDDELFVICNDALDRHLADAVEDPDDIDAVLEEVHVIITDAIADLRAAGELVSYEQEARVLNILEAPYTQ